MRILHTLRDVLLRGLHVLPVGFLERPFHCRKHGPLGNGHFATDHPEQSYNAREQTESRIALITEQRQPDPSQTGDHQAHPVDPTQPHQRSDYRPADCSAQRKAHAGAKRQWDLGSSRHGGCRGLHCRHCLTTCGTELGIGAVGRTARRALDAPNVIGSGIGRCDPQGILRRSGGLHCCGGTEQILAPRRPGQHLISLSGGRLHRLPHSFLLKTRHGHRLATLQAPHALARVFLRDPYLLAATWTAKLDYPCTLTRRGLLRAGNADGLATLRTPDALARIVIRGADLLLTMTAPKLDHRLLHLMGRFSNLPRPANNASPAPAVMVSKKTASMMVQECTVLLYYSVSRPEYQATNRTFFRPSSPAGILLTGLVCI
ncbi:MAG TPA: hypothetical protein VMW72_08430 [Sedimentisphaerales bacterium]|nr:hypothetical protein [Sedimentisphaerales bacterium]